MFQALIAGKAGFEVPAKVVEKVTGYLGDCGQHGG